MHRQPKEAEGKEGLTQLLERGLSPEDVAAQLGHKDGGGLVRRLYGTPTSSVSATGSPSRSPRYP
jgi:hypothetical protein